MRAAVVLFCFVAIQAVLGVWGAKKPSLSDLASAVKKHNGQQSKPSNVSQTILGGEANGRQNFYVMLFASDESGLCSGALITEQVVLTTASCVERSKGLLMYAFLGLYDFYQTDYYELNRITPDFFFTHPDYDCSNQYYDIAIGVMETPTTFSDLIAPVSLPWGADGNTIFTGMATKMYGYGSLYDDTLVYSTSLQVKYQEVQPMETCWSYDEYYDMDSYLQLCTARSGEQSGACWGDEGAPLIYTTDNDENILIGLATFQPYVCPPYSDFPSRFTKVSYYFDWLQGLTGIGGGGGGSGGGGGGSCSLKSRLKLKKLKIQKLKEAKAAKKKASGY